MIEICILSENQIFAEDLAQQIEKYVSDCTVIVNEVHNKSIVFVDENESLLKKVIKEEKAQYFVLLSKDKEIDESTVMMNEMTGMIQRPPDTDIESVVYNEIYPVHKQIPKKKKK